MGSRGVAFSTVGGKATYPEITGDASGGIIAWQDSRNASSDIYASGVSSSGVLPVKLISFNAMIEKDKVELDWQTATEVKNFEFEVERQILKQVQNDSNDWEKIGFVAGHGNSNSPKDYSFVDANPPSGKLQYRLKQIDTDGSFEYSQEVEVKVEDNPTEFVLEQNYPNPFNPSTTISFSIPMSSFDYAQDDNSGVTLRQTQSDRHVTLKVYDIFGREGATLVNENKTGGKYEIKFDGSNLASGIYSISYKPEVLRRPKN